MASKSAVSDIHIKFVPLKFIRFNVGELIKILCRIEKMYTIAQTIHLYYKDSDIIEITQDKSAYQYKLILEPLYNTSDIFINEVYEFTVLVSSHNNKLYIKSYKYIESLGPNLKIHNAIEKNSPKLIEPPNSITHKLSKSRKSKKSSKSIHSNNYNDSDCFYDSDDSDDSDDFDNLSDPGDFDNFYRKQNPHHNIHLHNRMRASIRHRQISNIERVENIYPSEKNRLLSTDDVLHETTQRLQQQHLMEKKELLEQKEQREQRELMEEKEQYTHPIYSKNNDFIQKCIITNPEDDFVNYHKHENDVNHSHISNTEDQFIDDLFDLYP